MKVDTKKSLGSAKSGLHHWIIQRVSALALIPLGVWFMGVFILLFSAPYEIAHDWLSSPWTVTLAILFIFTLFYHGYLGLQVIFEDYVSNDSLKWFLILTTKMLSILMALLAIVSILRIFLD